MTAPRRWPLHPAPLPGEALSSWLRRIAACYSAELEVLGDDLGFTVRPGSHEDIDLVPPPGMIDVLTSRTGVAPDRSLQMSVAGWVPWLLDDMQPSPESFATYTRQLSVLRPAGRFKSRLVPSWRPWLSSHLHSRACPKCVAASDSPKPYLLLWALPLISTCPIHGCWLQATLAPRGYFRLWDFDPPVPRAAPEHLLKMDQRTQYTFTIGQVELPRRSVHAGIWFRLLRTIIDELSCPLSENHPADAKIIRQIWTQTGYRVRDGQSSWHPYEQLAESVQQHTMEAAATAVMLLETGAITGSGTDAPLFHPVPDFAMSDGTPSHPPSTPAGARPTLMDALKEAVDAARVNPADARTLFNLATYKRDDAEHLHEMVNAFIDLSIPLDFHHTTQNMSGLQDVD